MRYIYEFFIPYLECLELKLSCAAFALYMSINFGASEYLLLLVQYLFIADFIVGIVDAKKAKKFSWSKVWLGIKKIVSLYLGVLVVGFGTKAFDVTLQGRVDIAYNGAFLFDLFIYLLILFELASINRHLAHLGFGVNKILESFFDKIIRKINRKINKILDGGVDKSFECIEKNDVKPKPKDKNEL